MRKTSEIVVPGQWLAPLAVIILGFMAATVVIQGKEESLFILFCLSLSIIVLTSETLALIILFLLSFYSYFLQSILSVPPIFMNLMYIVVLLLAIRLFSIAVIKNRPMPKTSIDGAVLFLAALISLSFALNRPPVGAALKSILHHFSFILLFYVLAYSDFKESTLKKLIQAIIIVAFIQVLASFLQYFFILYDMPQGFRQDQSGGLFGWSSGTINAVFMIYTFSILFAFIKVYGLNFLLTLGIFLLVVPIVLSSARAGLIFFFLTGLFLLTIIPLLRGRILKVDIPQGLAVISFLVLGMFLVAGKNQLAFIMNPKEVYDYSTGGTKRLRRIDQIEFAHSHIRARAETLIFGLGPGQITNTRQATIGGTTRSDFLEENKDDVRRRQSYMYITLELGYGGLILFLFVHYKLFIVSARIFKGVDDKFWKAIALGFCGIVFTAAYSIVYVQTWVRPPLVFPFWLIAGSLYRIGRIKGF